MGDCLVGDIGGTKTRLALVTAGAKPAHASTLRNDSCSGLAALISTFLADIAPADRPRTAALCIAGPVTGDRLRLTNRAWDISVRGLRRSLDLESLSIVNDFTAIAMSVPFLTGADLEPVLEPVPEPAPQPGVHVAGVHMAGVHMAGVHMAGRPAAVGVLGPGTGLGVSGLLPRHNGTAGDRWVPLQGEGGHVTLPQTTAQQAAVAAWLRDRYGTASAERAVSGPGLVNLYQALAAQAGQPVRALQPKDITGHARAGDDPLCVAATRLFSETLGQVAGDLALTLGAKGGLFLGGGVLWNMRDVFDRAAFRAAFTARGRFTDYVRTIPVWQITYAWPALLGLSRLLAGDVGLAGVRDPAGS